VIDMGGELSYAIVGTGPPVLAIQGAGLIGRGWKPQFDGLSHQFTFVTFDNRGIGGSSRGAGDLTIERMADDARAVADAAGLDRFHVLGHSMGGLIAQHLALTSRDRVKSLALLCTFADGRRARDAAVGANAPARAAKPHRHESDATGRDDQDDHAGCVHSAK